VVASQAGREHYEQIDRMCRQILTSRAARCGLGAQREDHRGLWWVTPQR
jgi:hypothetical protein